MLTRKIFEVITLLSILPLASCATPDENPEGANVSPLNAETNNAPINNANLNESINNAANANLNANLGNNLNNNSGNNLANNSNNMLVGEDDDGSMDEGDADFDNLDGNLADAAAASPAADAGAAIEGFENEKVNQNFLNNPAPSTTNIAAANAAPASNEGLNSFKSAPAENGAFASNAATENLSANAAIPSVPAPTPVEAPKPAPVPSAPVAAAQDVEATPSILRWVGFRINESVKKLNVEFMTEGRPEYEIFESQNRSGQSELIFRFYHTTLRKKLKWDVNSSEFRSPVAYIRMKNREAEGLVDLIITHRDKIQPGFYEKGGNFILSYEIPERYFNELDLTQKAKVKDKALSLKSGHEAPLAKPKVVASKFPLVGIPRYMTSLREEPKFQPIRNFLKPKRIRNGKDGFPESFDRSPIRAQRTGEILTRITLVGVAQDNLEDDFGNENSGENSTNENLANEGEGNNFGNGNNASTNNANVNNLGNNSNLNANSANKAGNNAAANTTNIPASNAGNSNLSGNNGTNLENLGEAEQNSGLGNNAAPDAFSNIENKSNGNAAKNSFSNGMTPAAEAPNAAVGADPLTQSTPGEDVEPEDAGGKKAKYSGKPIFMEFYESPLSLVLKSFSEETGNNFVFPGDVGATPITIQFRGVPWDEALKAILETYSLGMVRIGENVVRVDRIASLTGYMQALEQASQYESRRVPTKVLVYRLNNGVSKDVSMRLEKLLARDILLDDRIKISDDDRTNSIVIEAPTLVLAKAKAIVERLDLDTPQVEIMSRIVEVQKNNSDFLGVAWGSNANFDPGRALGFGTLNFPNSAKSSFSVDPGVSAAQGNTGNGSLRLGSLNKFLDLDLFLKMEEKKGRTNILQSNRVLVLDGRKASVSAGMSKFFRPAAGGNVINPAPGAVGGGGGEASGLSEITFNLGLTVTPQVTALGNVIMDLDISSDTPGDTTGEALASKGTRNLTTQMVRASGDTGVIGGIYDTKRTNTVIGVPFLSDLPIIGALFRSTITTDSQTELLIMVTPTIMSNSTKSEATAKRENEQKTTVLSQKKTGKKGAL